MKAFNFQETMYFVNVAKRPDVLSEQLYPLEQRVERYPFFLKSLAKLFIGVAKLTSYLLITSLNVIYSTFVFAKDSLLKGLRFVMTAGSYTDTLNEFETNNSDEYARIKKDVLTALFSRELEGKKIHIERPGKGHAEYKIQRSVLDMFEEQSIEGYEANYAKQVEEKTKWLQPYAALDYQVNQLVENTKFRRVRFAFDALIHSVSKPLPQSVLGKVGAVLRRLLQVVVGLVVMPLLAMDYAVEHYVLNPLVLVLTVALMIPRAALTAVLVLPTVMLDVVKSIYQPLVGKDRPKDDSGSLDVGSNAAVSSSITTTRPLTSEQEPVIHPSPLTAPTNHQQGGNDNTDNVLSL